MTDGIPRYGELIMARLKQEGAWWDKSWAEWTPDPLWVPEPIESGWDKIPWVAGQLSDN